MNTTLGLIAAAVLLVARAATAQQPPPMPGSMANMPGMSSTPPRDMAAQMKQCADMRKSMRPGAPMSPQMQALMQRCDKMDRDMTPTQAPPDTLGR